MGVEWTPISWPLTGGIETKKSPLAVAPGSHIRLENVRQERDNEWRARNGWTHSAIDDLPSFPVREVGLPGGGRVAMTNESGTSPAGLLYESGDASARWRRMDSTICGQTTPGLWARSAISAADAVVQVDYCEGSVYSLEAQAGFVGASLGLYVRIQNKTDGTVLPNSATWPTGLISATGIRPRCIAVNGLLWLIYVETSTNKVVAQAWNDSTGAPSVVNAIQPSNVNAIHFMDAFSYTASSVTVVFRDSAGTKMRFQEFNSTTGANITNVLVAAVDCDVGLSLCPDPDLSGIRFAMVSTTSPVTAMVRLNSAGVVQTLDVLDTVASTAMTGCGYAAGAGYIAIYSGAKFATAKKVGGIVGAPLVLAASGPYSVDSVAWRGASTDAMHVLVGIHANGATDPQDSYFEIAIPYATGSATSVNSFPEPQARLLPLQAGPWANAVTPGHLPHMQDLFGSFVGALLRKGRYGVAAGAEASQYAVDRWQVTYLAPSNFPPMNIGQGTVTNSAAFLPSGQLLTSAGAALVGHGLCCIPIKPTLTPAVGALTYGYLIVVEVPNEAGDIWRSPPSTVATATSAAFPISVGVVISALELAERIITVKIYRTKNGGSVFQLVNARTGKASGLLSFTFADSVSDTTLGTGDFYFGEVPATITPAFSHVAVFGNRLFGIERDFPNLWMSKPLQRGLQPEFPGVTPWVVPLADEKGAPTQMYALDDKLMIHKTSAIYSVSGDGPDNLGGGSSISVTRIDSDVGSVAGTPVVSTGAEAFFVSARGINRVDRSANVDYVGAGVDFYLNQPELQVPLTILGGVFSSKTNEIRFIGMTSFGGQMYSLVYDRFHGTWCIDRGAGAGVSSTGFALSRISSGGQEIRYTNGGAMSFEGTAFVTDDAGTPFVPLIGSAWIQAATPQGRFRLRRARALGATSVAGGSITPVMSVLWNFDETGLISPIKEQGSPSAPIVDAANAVRAEFAPRNQKCTAFRLQLQLPSGNTTFRLEQWAAVVGIKRGPQKLTTAERWT